MVQRYEAVWTIDGPVMGQAEDGGYVAYADFAALEAERDRLTQTRPMPGSWARCIEAAVDRIEAGDTAAMLEADYPDEWSAQGDEPRGGFRAIELVVRERDRLREERDEMRRKGELLCGALGHLMLVARDVIEIRDSVRVSLKSHETWIEWYRQHPEDVVKYDATCGGPLFQKEQIARYQVMLNRLDALEAALGLDESTQSWVQSRAQEYDAAINPEQEGDHGDT
jgi:hypothetical protein